MKRAQVWIGIAIVCTAIAAAAYYGTIAMVGSGTLSRAHPAVWLNAIDLAARGVLVLAIGALISLVLSDRIRAIVVRFGRGSLVAYVVHLPFCYGRFGEPLRDRLDLLSATALGVILIALSWLAVYLRDLVKARVTSRP